MKLLLIPAVALILGQADEAETLFKKMEEKIAKAKSIQMKLSGEMEEAKFKLTGMLYMDEGAQVRLEVQGKSEGVEKNAVVISDGKKVYLKSNDDPKANGFAAPETFSRLIRVSFARAGLLSAFEFCDSESRAKTDPENGYTLSGFKLGAKEKVGEVEAQVITFTVTRKKRDAAVTLWIDPATRLPLKRTLKMEGASLSETYTDFKIDEKIDAAKFEVPKESK